MISKRLKTCAASTGNRVSGFSLVELMIVLAVIGIVASLAFPGYGKYMTEKRRLDGQLLLQNNAIILDRCLTFLGSYDSDCQLITESKEGFYTLDETRTRSTFTLNAVPTEKNGQSSDDDCQTFTLDNLGNRDATGTNPDICWRS